MRYWATAMVTLATAVPASAQSMSAGLQPGETALHIVAHGEVSSRADRITLPVTVTGRGPTAAAAHDAAEAGAAQLTAALVAAGIDRGSITHAPAAVRVMPAIPIVAPPAGVAAVSRTPTRVETAIVQVVAPDTATLDRVRQVVAQRDDAQAGTPVPSLRDEGAARRAATRDAIAQARRDADDYAAALGLRVVRVVGAANAAGLGDGLESLAQEFRDFGEKKPSDQVVTRATAVVDYALAPRS